jgi:hypothetical protein
MKTRALKRGSIVKSNNLNHFNKVNFDLMSCFLKGTNDWKESCPVFVNGDSLDELVLQVIRNQGKGGAYTTLYEIFHLIILTKYPDTVIFKEKIKLLSQEVIILM